MQLLEAQNLSFLFCLLAMLGVLRGWDIGSFWVYVKSKQGFLAV
jgi:hypothetical protein